MKFNNLSKFIIVTCLITITTGCKKFVDLTPEDQIPASGYYKTQLDISNALLGAYGNLRAVYNTYYIMNELPSDNARTYSPSESANGPFDKLTWLVDNSVILSSYQNAYRIISYCNIILNRIDAVPFTSNTLKKQYIAEAKFLRGLMYFNLVRNFGDVPLVLKEITIESEAYTYLRVPANDVYAQIEKDLIESSTDLLPSTLNATSKLPTADAGRATIGAANSLLGKVYLQEKKWAQAETVLAKVVSSNIYQLLPDVNNVLGLGKDNNAEIIFAAQFLASGNGEGNTYVYGFVPQGSTGITNVAGGSTMGGTLDLYNAFEQLPTSTPTKLTYDLRRDAWIVQSGTGTAAYYYPKKFIYSVSVTNEGDNDWPILRYADVLLMYAEALNNNGKTQLATTYINQIRTRAGLSAKPSNLTSSDAQLSIEQERRVELCFEGQRWYDLIRWGKAVSTVQAFKLKYITNDPLNANIDIVGKDYKLLYPIPFREIQLNPNLTQNPGY